MPENQFVCEECKKIIEKIICHTHDESYEVGHGDNCPYKQTVKESCVATE
ncbi:hypothetical protein HZB05_00085 [Candidatus Wolfebacteria bacterium]|nr:hypothetical protein [Candidatus Wolfebacteria bacterium]